MEPKSESERVTLEAYLHMTQMIQVCNDRFVSIGEAIAENKALLESLDKRLYNGGDVNELKINYDYLTRELRRWRERYVLIPPLMIVIGILVGLMIAHLHALAR